MGSLSCRASHRNRPLYPWKPPNRPTPTSLELRCHVVFRTRAALIAGNGTPFRCSQLDDKRKSCEPVTVCVHTSRIAMERRAKAGS
eukprot:Skav213125  [mRNA]  locus=scaffold107:154971:157050:+ [translate_table: standard]